MKRTFGLLRTAGVAALVIAAGCDGPRVGEALDPAGGSAGVGNAGSSSGGQSSGGSTAGNGGSVGGAPAGGSSAGGSGGTLGGEGGAAGAAGAAGSGACTGDGTSTRGPALVCIPGGTFRMGMQMVLAGLIATPIHSQTVESFYMDATEVTLGQYMECMADAPGDCTPPDDVNVDFDYFCYYPDTARSQYPANCVDWSQAKAFCEWAGKRLPTEIEWEYSVRSPSNRTYPWGEAAPSDQYCWAGTGGMLCPVGSYPASDTAEGLSDLAGNVWEMTSSYHCTYSEQGIGPPCDETKVIRRGGGFQTNALFAANGGFREELVPTQRQSDIGFRCAR